MENNTSNLLTNLKSLIKTYLVHDTQGRVIAAYEAKADAEVGAPCVLTMYGYRDATTTNIRYRKESNATWDPDDESWDSNLPALPSPVVDPAP